MMRSISFVAMLVLSTAACTSADNRVSSDGGSASELAPTRVQYDSLVGAGVPQAVFAGGCFWCMETAFDGVPGVLATISGYTGGTLENPTYDDVSSGSTGHTEAVAVFFDSTKVGYDELLQIYWRNVDPLTRDRQFCDAGTQYRAAIFYRDTEQQRLADSSKAAIVASRRFTAPIVTEIIAASAFTPAEEYHQDFATKQPLRYEAYREGCRRDQRLEELWGTTR